MPASQFGRTLLRRWYIALVGLVVTFGLAAAAVILVPARYQAQAVVLLLPPNGPAGANPYLNLGSLSGLSTVLNQALASGATVADVRAHGVTGDYAASDDTGSSGPLVLVTGQGRTPAEARRTAEYVTSLIPRTLQALQSTAGVHSNKSYVTSTVLNPVDKVTTIRKEQTRAVIAAGALGVLLTILMVAIAERYSITRSSRRATVVARPVPAVSPRNGPVHRSMPTTSTTANKKTTRADDAGDGHLGARRPKPPGSAGFEDVAEDRFRTVSTTRAASRIRGAAKPPRSQQSARLQVNGADETGRHS